MNRILTSVVFVVLLFPSLALGEEVTIDDLVVRDGLHYKKFTDVPFTGKVTGKTLGSFNNGKKNGPWVTYFKNGQLEYKATYKNGKLDGALVTYFKNGQLKSKGTYKDDIWNGPWVYYHKNGQLKSKGTYKNGKYDGLWVNYHKDGRLRWEATYENGVKIIYPSPPPPTD